MQTYQENNRDDLTQETRVPLRNNENNLPFFEGNPQGQAIK